ncbi:lasso peptide biosynthesis PqqD family chaperone [Aquirufa nivalisilvae]
MHSSTQLTLNTIISSNSSNIMSNVLHDEVVIMDLKNGNYLNLNRIGTAIWDLIKNPIAIHDLIQALLLKYDVEEQACQTHVLEFLNTLILHDLLIIES